MYRTRVGVLRGGSSEEYEVSLNTGATILANLPRERYEPVDIFINRAGEWHLRGKPTPPERALGQIDVAFIGLHGSFGEDGKVQRILECHAVPYTGSDSFASAVAMNKPAAKSRVMLCGIATAKGRTINEREGVSEQLVDILSDIGLPAVIKPAASGSSFGVTIAQSEGEARVGIEAAFQFGDSVLVEQYVEGTEATCGVIEKFRGQEYYALPPVEIVPAAHKTFFDYEAKYQGASLERCPAEFPLATKREIERLAILAHRELGLSHYSRSDFIVGKDGTIYFLEANTLPGLTEASLMPKAVDAIGCSLPLFLDHVVSLALETGPRRRC